MQTLMITDLSVSLELDRDAMIAVRGGQDQGNGPIQANAQNMAAAPTASNASVRGTTAVESNNTFVEYDSKHSDSRNVEGWGFGFGYPWYTPY